MKNIKEIRRGNIVSFGEFTADPYKYRVERNIDYSLRGVETSSNLVKLIKEISRKKHLGQ